MAGRQVTLDDRGQPVVVSAPTGARLPDTELPVSALVEGAPASLGQSVVSALKATAAAQLLAAPLRKPELPKPTPAPSASSTAAAAAAAAASSKPVDPGRYFRKQPGVQPSLVDTLGSAGGVAAGVTVVEAGGKSVAGPPAATGISITEFERTRKAKFSGTTTLRARPPMPGATAALPGGGGSSGRAPLPAPGAGKAALPDGAAAGSSGGSGAAGGLSMSMVDSLDVALRATRFSPLPSGAAPTNLLASIPDVVSRPASTPLQAAAASLLAHHDSGVGASTSDGGALVSPKPGSGLVFRTGVPSRRTHSPTAGAGGGGAPPVMGGAAAGSRVSPVASMPAEEPSLTVKQRQFAMGDVSRRPRDRAAAATVTGPRAHLPPPPFPATSHFDPLARASVASGDAGDDMLVVDGSVDGEGSATLNEAGILVPARFAAVSPLSDMRSSGAPSPVGGAPRAATGSGAAAPPMLSKDWGSTASRRGGGRVRIGSDGVMTAAGGGRGR